MAAYVQDCILLFGDSLTQFGLEAGGISQLLASQYARRLDVVNRGFSGYNTKWSVNVFEQCFAKRDERQNVPKVRLLVIWLGANDAARPPSVQHVPLEQFIINLRKLIHTVTDPESPRYSPETRLILATPTPVEEILAAKMLGSTERTFDVTKEYAMAVRDVGAAEGVPVADVWTRIWEESGKEEKALGKYLLDGLHLSSAGYQIAHQVFMEVVAENYPELLPDNLQTTFPLWRDMRD